MQGFGLGLGLTQRRAGVSNAAILALFSNGEQGAWYDPSDLTTMFQDAAGTVPVTGDNQMVGRILDKRLFLGRTTAAMIAIYGSVLAIPGNHASQVTDSAKPTYHTNGVLHWLMFDGMDDFLVTGNIDFSAKDEVSVFAGLLKASDANTGDVLELSNNINTNSGAFVLYAPRSSGISTYGFACAGTVQSGAFGSPHAAPHLSVAAGLGKISAPSVVLRVNGAQEAASNAAQGTGNYGNYPLYVGRRGGSTLPFTGNIYGLIVRGALTADPQLTQAEKWMAKRTGVAI